MKLSGLVPMLETSDLEATIDYYTRTLGFELDATWPSEGLPTWCRLVAGDVVLMFMAPDDDARRSTPTITGQLYCYPPDVDALWAELRDKVDVVSPIADWDHGVREFQVRDCNGYVLRFGQELASSESRMDAHEGEAVSATCSRRSALRTGAMLTAAAVAGSWSRPPDASADPTEISEAEIEGLVQALDAERQAWIEGRFDPSAPGAMLQAPDMTIFGPFGGDAGAGGPELLVRQKRVNASFRGGSGHCEVVRSIAADDLLVLLLIERNQVRFEGRTEPHAWALRTTQVFRRDGDRWIRLHRHADPLVSRRSLEATLALLESP